MIYAVEKYMDVIKAREKRHDPPYDGHYVYFDTEQEAKDFIVSRARTKLANAEAAMKNAKRKLAKVVKKFGTPCQHNVDDPEECGLCDDAIRSAANGSTSQEQK